MVNILHTWRLLQSLSLNLVCVGQGGADILRNARVTNLCCPARQLTGNREALITKNNGEKRGSNKRSVLIRNMDNLHLPMYMCLHRGMMRQ